MAYSWRHIVITASSALCGQCLRRRPHAPNCCESLTCAFGWTACLAACGVAGARAGGQLRGHGREDAVTVPPSDAGGVLRSLEQRCTAQRAGFCAGGWSLRAAPVAAYGLSNSSLGGCCAGLHCACPGTAVNALSIGVRSRFWYQLRIAAHVRTVSTASRSAVIWVYE